MGITAAARSDVLDAATETTTEAGTDGSEMEKLQRLVFEQLSRLHHLTTFNITPNRHTGANSYSMDTGMISGLDFRLCVGLGMLSGLKLISQINVSGTAQRMGQEDIEWMIDHWKDLKRIDGVLNHEDEALNKRLVIGLLFKHKRTPSQGLL
ncbi:hypothetical protein BGX31_011572 [Mortierella sp. GBA43]|nr:hypothetical protein BGX31_011572 [Mortierella sp. GBA43]